MSKMIDQLPTELIEMIAGNIGKYTIKVHVLKAAIDNSSLLYVVAAKRILLWYKIMARYRRLHRYITNRIKKSFDRCSYWTCQTGCVYYAPHIPNALCRFCWKHKKDHAFSNKLIETFYI